jgi:hypothetical protein
MTRSRDVADTQDNLGGAVAPVVSGKNAIINGGFDIWQRGTSVANSSVGYTADRYFLQSYNAMTVSQQATGDTTNLPNITYSGRVQRNSGATGVNFVYFTQSIESLNARQFAGKVVTFSFYARRGANFSGASNTIGGEVLSGTGTDQSVLGYTGSTNVLSTSAILTTTWQRFTFSGTVPATSNELGFYIGYTPVGTAGAADYFEITGVQLEIGAVATPFSRAGGSIGGELALCQRYYVRNTGGDAYSHIGQGIANATNQAYIEMKLPVQMRIVPTSIDYSTVALYDGVSIISTSLSLALLSQQSGVQVGSINASGITGLTQYRFYFIINNASASGYVGFSAEL